jgi:hypothetical protein
MKRSTVRVARFLLWGDNTAPSRGEMPTALRRTNARGTFRSLIQFLEMQQKRPPICIGQALSLEMSADERTDCRKWIITKLAAILPGGLAWASYTHYWE